MPIKVEFITATEFHLYPEKVEAKQFDATDNTNVMHVCVLFAVT